MVVAAATATETVVVAIATTGIAALLMDADCPLLAITASVATWSAAGVEVVDVLDVWCSTLAGAPPEFAAVGRAVLVCEVCGSTESDARRCDEGVFLFGDSSCGSELFAARSAEVWASGGSGLCVNARASEVAAVSPSRLGTEAGPAESS